MHSCTSFLKSISRYTFHLSCAHCRLSHSVVASPRPSSFPALAFSDSAITRSPNCLLLLFSSLSQSSTYSALIINSYARCSHSLPSHPFALVRLYSITLAYSYTFIHIQYTSQTYIHRQFNPTSCPSSRPSLITSKNKTDESPHTPIHRLRPVSIASSPGRTIIVQPSGRSVEVRVSWLKLGD